MSTRANVRNEVRSLLTLWPDQDTLAEALDATESGVDVTDGTRFREGGIVETEETSEAGREIMLVRSISGNTLTVRRGARGTTAAAHANGQTVGIYGPHDITDTELNKLVRDAINWLYPIVLRDIWDDTLTTAVGTLKYTIPSGLEYLEEVYLQDSRTPTAYNLVATWQIQNELVASVSTPKLWFPAELPSGRTLRLHGFGKFTQPTSDTSTLDFADALMPAVKFFIASMIVKTQEALRTRFTEHSALLESRSGNVPDLIGSSRELIAQAIRLRAQFAVPRRWRLRRIQRND